MSQMNPAYIHIILFKNFNIILLCSFKSPKGAIIFNFPTKILHKFIFPVRATCPAKLILLDLTTLTFCEDQNRQTSSRTAAQVSYP